MKLGTTYFEKYVSEAQGCAHIEFLSESGFSSLEFSPHDRLLSHSALKQLHKRAESHRMETSFHSPDFIDPSNYQVAFFKESSAVKNAYSNLIHLIADLDTLGRNHNLVIHGASATFINGDLAQTTLANQRFFDWILNKVLQQNLPVSICLENTCQLDEIGTTQSSRDLIHFFKQFKGAPLFLCMDIPHWIRQCKLENEAPEKLFDSDMALLLDRINYAHIHGMNVDLTKSHLRIKNEDCAIFDFVNRLSEQKNEINFNLEIFDVQEFVNISTYESILNSSFRAIIENCRK